MPRPIGVIKVWSPRRLPGVTELVRPSRVARQRATIAAGPGLVSRVPRSNPVGSGRKSREHRGGGEATVGSGRTNPVHHGRARCAAEHPLSITKGGSACAALIASTPSQKTGGKQCRQFGQCRSTAQRASPGA